MHVAIRLSVSFFLFQMMICPLLQAQSGCDRWSTARRTFFDTSLANVVWDGSRFVALDYGGSLLQSPDGASWTLLEDLHFEDGGKAWGLAWTGEDYIAVGETRLNAGRMFSGPNIDTLSRQNPGARYPLYDVISNGSVHVAAGMRGVVSSNGSGWTSTYYTGSDPVGRVYWKGGRFFAMGDLDTVGDTRALTSTDGFNWTEVVLDSTKSTSGDDATWALAFDGERYLATTYGYRFYTSTDGLNWERQVNDGTRFELDDMLWDGSRFIGVGPRGIAQSVDGLTWTPIIEGDLALNRLIWNGTFFLAVGPDSYHLRSENGSDWTRFGTLSNGITADLAGNGKTWVSVGAAGTISYSSDGLEWTPANSPTYYDLAEVVWARSRFVAVGNQGTIVTSEDGIHWQLEDSGTLDSLLTVAHNGNLFVAIGYQGIVLASVNGTSWTAWEDKLDVSVDKVFAFKSNFYAWRNNHGNFLRSATGSTWEAVSSPASQLESMGTDGETIVAFGWPNFPASGPSIYHSTDAENWTDAGRADQSVRTVIGGEAGFVGLGTKKTRGLWTSPDGEVWANSDAQSHVVFNAAAWDGSKFCMAAPGVSAVSEDLLNWEPNLYLGSYESVVETPAGGYMTLGQGWQLESNDGLDWWVRGNTSVPITRTVGRNGRRLAMVSQYFIAVSDDGLSWDEMLPPVDIVKDIFYAGGYFFLNTFSSNVFFRSSDGVDWQEVTPDVDPLGRIDNLLYVNDTFTAYDNNGNILFSDDGVQWDLHQLPENYYGSLFHMQDHYLIVDTSNNGPIVTSEDALEWSHDFPASITESLAYGNGVYVAGGRSSVAVSNDGLTWENLDMPQCESMRTLIWDGTRFLAACGRNIYESPMGRVWSEMATLDFFISKLIFADDHYLAVDFSHSAMKSSDGKSWTPVNIDLGFEGNIQFLRWDGSQYYGHARDSNARYHSLHSKDGLSWTVELEPENIQLKASNGEIEVGSSNEACYYRNRGEEWQTANTPFGAFFFAFDIVWTGTNFFLRGSKGLTATSSNGKDWHSGMLPDLDPAGHLVHANGSYLILDDSQLLTSQNGEDWTIHALDTTFSPPIVGNRTRLFQSNSHATLTIDDTLTPHYYRSTYQPGRVLPTENPNLFFNALSRQRPYEMPNRPYGEDLRTTLCSLTSLGMGWSVWRQPDRIFCNTTDPNMLDYAAYLNNGNACDPD